MRFCMPLVVENHRDISGELKPEETGRFSPMDLPADYTRGPGEEVRRAEKTFALSGWAEAAVIRAVFEVLLRRYCGEADGTPFNDLVKQGLSPRTKDLVLEFDEQQARGRISYNADLFKPETIERIIAQLQTLAESAERNRAQPISRLPILPETERQQLLTEWNDTRADYPTTKCVHELIAEQAARTPDQIAVVFEDKSLTYAELDARANALAAHLQSLGVKTETRVGICVPRSLDMIVGLLGILKAGGAYVPMDPSYPKERLAFMMEDAQAPLLLTQSALKASAPPGNARVVCIDETDLTEKAQPTKAVGPDNLSYVIYTSGSTGKPKGVMVQHRNVVNFFTGMDRAIGAEMIRKQPRR